MVGKKLVANGLIAVLTVSLYVLREVVKPTLIALVFLLALGVVSQMLRQGELAAQLAMPTTDLVLIAVLLLPDFLVLALPLALFIGTLVAFGRMAAEGEITILRTFGLGLGRLLPMPLLVGTIASGVALLCAMYLGPTSVAALQQRVVEAAYRLATSGLIAGRFIEVTKGWTVYVRQKDLAGNIEGILVHDGRKKDRPVDILADRGRIIAEPQLGSLRFELQRGEIHRRDTTHKRYQHSTFDVLSMRLDLLEAMRVRRRFASPLKTMDVQLLAAHITQLERRGRSSRVARLELHRRLALSLAPLIFVLLGGPLGVWMRRGGAGWVIPVASAIVLLYYLLLRAAETACLQGTLSPALAAWIPSAICLMLAGPCAWLARRR